MVKFKKLQDHSPAQSTSDSSVNPPINPLGSPINPLVDAAEKLSTALKAGSPVVAGLVEQMRELLDLRIKNEMRVLRAIDEGFLIPVGEKDAGKISPEALAMHRASKDSISELVKVKELLEGKPTERVSVEDEGNQFSMERLAKMRGGN